MFETETIFNKTLYKDFCNIEKAKRERAKTPTCFHWVHWILKNSKCYTKEESSNKADKTFAASCGGGLTACSRPDFADVRLTVDGKADRKKSLQSEKASKQCDR
ncbi:hypothetical protein WA026_009526 [Henosepilachna vigintioctopunctata]|uniref:Uncharacterized protein n=1 Tax=Henosepilachna vigintioctopunctata TaxID=420089 RepID=A0AAW1U402_9CUCU